MNNHFSRSLAPIDRSGITELVVQRIKELLQQGELKAGSRLPPEHELAEMLSISRPSLRLVLTQIFSLTRIRGQSKGLNVIQARVRIPSEPSLKLTKQRKV